MSDFTASLIAGVVTLATMAVIFAPAFAVPYALTTALGPGPGATLVACGCVSVALLVAWILSLL